MLKGFYTTNELEIDPNYGSYNWKTTEAERKEDNRIFEELFSENKMQLGMMKKIYSNMS
jgi:hypothetical protein